ncbi:MAG: hypothetical protein KF901_08075 [Myxococcales bacterium]|nr:hypothetical protein [Myxococcales bacterium]
MDFPEGEALLDEAALEWARGYATPPPTVLRAYLLDGDWLMDRTDLGVVSHRFVPAVIYYRGGQSGNCYGLAVLLYQAEQAGAWGRPSMRSEVQPSQVSCAAVLEMRGAPP